MPELISPLAAFLGGGLSTAVAAILALGALIFFHELGHFVVAKAFGVGVVKFSMGFGRTIVGRKIGETEYVLSWIPLGGYVKMVGETPGEWMNEEAEIPEGMDPSRSFSRRSPWVRMAIALAGPAFNLVLAVFVYWCIYAFQGLPVDGDGSSTRIGEVTPGGPAFEVGIKKGDEIVAVAGTAVEDWDALRHGVRDTAGKPFVMTVRRDDELLDFKLSAIELPGAAEAGAEPRYIVGILGSLVYQAKPPLEALGLAVDDTIASARAIPMVLLEMLSGNVSPRQIQGPIGIVGIAGKQFEQGIFPYLKLVALISVNLGVLNLLPIPVLDGGMILVCLVEVVRRRPMTAQSLGALQQAGLVFLLFVMALALFNDMYNISPFGRAHIEPPTTSTFRVQVE